MKHAAVQCGFCTPGMLLQGYALIEKKAELSRAQIISGMDTHLCRCGSYVRIVDAIQSVANEQEGR